MKFVFLNLFLLSTYFCTYSCNIHFSNDVSNELVKLNFSKQEVQDIQNILDKRPKMRRFIQKEITNLRKRKENIPLKVQETINWSTEALESLNSLSGAMLEYSQPSILEHKNNLLDPLKPVLKRYKKQNLLIAS